MRDMEGVDNADVAVILRAHERENAKRTVELLDGAATDLDAARFHYGEPHVPIGWHEADGEVLLSIWNPQTGQTLEFPADRLSEYFSEAWVADIRGGAKKRDKVAEKENRKFKRKLDDIETSLSEFASLYEQVAVEPAILDESARNIVEMDQALGLDAIEPAEQASEEETRVTEEIEAAGGSRDEKAHLHSEFGAGADTPLLAGLERIYSAGGARWWIDRNGEPMVACAFAVARANPSLLRRMIRDSNFSDSNWRPYQVNGETIHGRDVHVAFARRSHMWRRGAAPDIAVEIGCAEFLPPTDSRMDQAESKRLFAALLSRNGHAADVLRNHPDLHVLSRLVAKAYVKWKGKPRTSVVDIGAMLRALSGSEPVKKPFHATRPSEKEDEYGATAFYEDFRRTENGTHAMVMQAREEGEALRIVEGWDGETFVESSNLDRAGFQYGKPHVPVSLWEQPVADGVQQWIQVMDTETGRTFDFLPSELSKYFSEAWVVNLTTRAGTIGKGEVKIRQSKRKEDASDVKPVYRDAGIDDFVAHGFYPADVFDALGVGAHVLDARAGKGAFVKDLSQRGISAIGIDSRPDLPVSDNLHRISLSEAGFGPDFDRIVFKFGLLGDSAYWAAQLRKASSMLKDDGRIILGPEAQPDALRKAAAQVPELRITIDRAVNDSQFYFELTKSVSRAVARTRAEEMLAHPELGALIERSPTLKSWINRLNEDGSAVLSSLLIADENSFAFLSADSRYLVLLPEAAVDPIAFVHEYIRQVVRDTYISRRGLADDVEVTYMSREVFIANKLELQMKRWAAARALVHQVRLEILRNGGPDIRQAEDALTRREDDIWNAVGDAGPGSAQWRAARQAAAEAYADAPSPEAEGCSNRQHAEQIAGERYDHLTGATAADMSEVAPSSADHELPAEAVAESEPAAQPIDAAHRESDADVQNTGRAPLLPEFTLDANGFIDAPVVEIIAGVVALNKITYLADTHTLAEIHDTIRYALPALKRAGLNTFFFEMGLQENNPQLEVFMRTGDVSHLQSVFFPRTTTPTLQMCRRLGIRCIGIDIRTDAAGDEGMRERNAAWARITQGTFAEAPGTKALMLGGGSHFAVSSPDLAPVNLTLPGPLIDFLVDFTDLTPGQARYGSNGTDIEIGVYPESLGFAEVPEIDFQRLAEALLARREASSHYNDRLLQALKNGGPDIFSESTPVKDSSRIAETETAPPPSAAPDDDHPQHNIPTQAARRGLLEDRIVNPFKALLYRAAPGKRAADIRAIRSRVQRSQARTLARDMLSNTEVRRLMALNKFGLKNALDMARRNGHVVEIADDPTHDPLRPGKRMVLPRLVLGDPVAFIRELAYQLEYTSAGAFVPHAVKANEFKREEFIRRNVDGILSKHGKARLSVYQAGKFYLSIGGPDILADEQALLGEKEAMENAARDTSGEERVTLLAGIYANAPSAFAENLNNRQWLEQEFGKLYDGQVSAVAPPAREGHVFEGDHLDILCGGDQTLLRILTGRKMARAIGVSAETMELMQQAYENGFTLNAREIARVNQGSTHADTRQVDVGTDFGQKRAANDYSIDPKNTSVAKAFAPIRELLRFLGTLQHELRHAHDAVAHPGVSPADFTLRRHFIDTYVKQRMDSEVHARLSEITRALENRRAGGPSSAPLWRKDYLRAHDEYRKTGNLAAIRKAWGEDAVANDALPEDVTLAEPEAIRGWYAKEFSRQAQSIWSRYHSEETAAGTPVEPPIETLQGLFARHPGFEGLHAEFGDAWLQERVAGLAEIGKALGENPDKERTALALIFLKRQLGQDWIDTHWRDVARLAAATGEQSGFVLESAASLAKAWGEEQWSTRWPDFARATSRLVEGTTAYNREGILQLVLGQKTVDMLHGKNADLVAHIDFAAGIVAQEKRLAYQILEGIVEGVEKKVVDAALPQEERERISWFVEKMRSFAPGLYAAYKNGGEAALQPILDFPKKMLVDDIGPADIERFIGRYGMDALVAAIQVCMPASGASFTKRGDIKKLLESYIMVGDRRDDVPAALRGQEFGGGEADRIALTEWGLKEGVSFDAGGRIGAMLDALRAPDARLGDDALDRLKQRDTERFRAALPAYLAGSCDARATGEMLEAFYAYARHGEQLGDRISSIERGEYHGLSALEEVFTDAETLRPLMRDELHRLLDAHPELALHAETGKKPLRDPKAIKNRMEGIWRSSRSVEDKTAILCTMLRDISLADVTNVLAPAFADEQLRAAVIDAAGTDAGDGRTMSEKQIADMLLDVPCRWIQAEKEHFESRELESSVVLKSRVVKGIAFGLWSLNAGVCIGKDIELWKDPRFMLKPLIDGTTDKVVGFSILYEQEINGRRVLMVMGVEPTVEFLSEVKARDVYPIIERQLIDVARTGGYDALQLPEDSFVLSNRVDIQKEVHKKYRHKWTQLPAPVRWNNVPKPYPVSRVYEVWTRAQAKEAPEPEVVGNRAENPKSTLIRDGGFDEQVDTDPSIPLPDQLDALAEKIARLKGKRIAVSVGNAGVTNEMLRKAVDHLKVPVFDETNGRWHHPVVLDSFDRVQTVGEMVDSEGNTLSYQCSRDGRTLRLQIAGYSEVRAKLVLFPSKELADDQPFDVAQVEYLESTGLPKGTGRLLLAALLREYEDWRHLRRLVFRQISNEHTIEAFKSNQEHPEHSRLAKTASAALQALGFEVMHSEFIRRQPSRFFRANPDFLALDLALDFIPASSAEAIAESSESAGKDEKSSTSDETQQTGEAAEHHDGSASLANEKRDAHELAGEPHVQPETGTAETDTSATDAVLPALPRLAYSRHAGQVNVRAAGRKNISAAVNIPGKTEGELSGEYPILEVVKVAAGSPAIGSALVAEVLKHYGIAPTRQLVFKDIDDSDALAAYAAGTHADQTELARHLKQALRAIGKEPAGARFATDPFHSELGVDLVIEIKFRTTSTFTLDLAKIKGADGYHSVESIAEHAMEEGVLDRGLRIAASSIEDVSMSDLVYLKKLATALDVDIHIGKSVDVIHPGVGGKVDIDLGDNWEENLIEVVESGALADIHEIELSDSGYAANKLVAQSIADYTRITIRIEKTDPEPEKNFEQVAPRTCLEEADIKNTDGTFKSIDEIKALAESKGYSEDGVVLPYEVLTDVYTDSQGATYASRDDVIYLSDLATALDTPVTIASARTLYSDAHIFVPREDGMPLSFEHGVSEETYHASREDINGEENYLNEKREAHLASLKLAEKGIKQIEYSDVANGKYELQEIADAAGVDVVGLVYSDARPAEIVRIRPPARLEYSEMRNADDTAYRPVEELADLMRQRGIPEEGILVKKQSGDNFSTDRAYLENLATLLGVEMSYRAGEYSADISPIKSGKLRPIYEFGMVYEYEGKTYQIAKDKSFELSDILCEVQQDNTITQIYIGLVGSDELNFEQVQYLADMSGKEVLYKTYFSKEYIVVARPRVCLTGSDIFATSDKSSYRSIDEAAAALQAKGIGDYGLVIERSQFSKIESGRFFSTKDKEYLKELADKLDTRVDVVATDGSAHPIYPKRMAEQYQKLHKQAYSQKAPDTEGRIRFGGSTRKLAFMSGNRMLKATGELFRKNLGEYLRDTEPAENLSFIHYGEKKYAEAVRSRPGHENDVHSLGLQIYESGDSPAHLLVRGNRFRGRMRVVKNTIHEMAHYYQARNYSDAFYGLKLNMQWERRWFTKKGVQPEAKRIFVEGGANLVVEILTGEKVTHTGYVYQTAAMRNIVEKAGVDTFLKAFFKGDARAMKKMGDAGVELGYFIRDSVDVKVAKNLPETDTIDTTDSTQSGNMMAARADSGKGPSGPDTSGPDVSKAKTVEAMQKLVRHMLGRNRDERAHDEVEGFSDYADLYSRLQQLWNGERPQERIIGAVPDENARRSSALTRKLEERRNRRGRVPYWDIDAAAAARAGATLSMHGQAEEGPLSTPDGLVRIRLHYQNRADARRMKKMFGRPSGHERAAMTSSFRTLSLSTRSGPQLFKFSGRGVRPLEGRQEAKELYPEDVAAAVNASKALEDHPEFAMEPGGIVLDLADGEAPITQVWRRVPVARRGYRPGDVVAPLHVFTDRDFAATPLGQHVFAQHRGRRPWLDSELAPKLAALLWTVIAKGIHPQLHAQNIDVIVGEDGRIVDIVIKDLGDIALDHGLRPADAGDWQGSARIEGRSPAELFHRLDNISFASARVAELASYHAKYLGQIGDAYFSESIGRELLRIAQEEGGLDPEQVKALAYQSVPMDSGIRLFGYMGAMRELVVSAISKPVSGTQEVAESSISIGEEAISFNQAQWLADEAGVKVVTSGGLMVAMPRVRLQRSDLVDDVSPVTARVLSVKDAAQKIRERHPSSNGYAISVYENVTGSVTGELDYLGDVAYLRDLAEELGQPITLTRGMKSFNTVLPAALERKYQRLHGKAALIPGRQAVRGAIQLAAMTNFAQDRQAVARKIWVQYKAVLRDYLPAHMEDAPPNTTIYPDYGSFADAMIRTNSDPSVKGLFIGRSLRSRLEEGDSSKRGHIHVRGFTDSGGPLAWADTYVHELSHYVQHPAYVYVFSKLEAVLHFVTRENRGQHAQYYSILKIFTEGGANLLQEIVTGIRVTDCYQDQTAIMRQICADVGTEVFLKAFIQGDEAAIRAMSDTAVASGYFALRDPAGMDGAVDRLIDAVSESYEKRESEPVAASGAAPEIPEDTGLIGVSEYIQRFNRLVERFRPLGVPIHMECVPGRDGETVAVHVRIGEGKLHHVNASGVHPNESHSLLADLNDAERWCLNPGELAEKDLTIHYYCLDLPGLRRNEGGLLGQPEPHTYAENHYRAEVPVAHPAWGFTFRHEGYSYTATEPSVVDFMRMIEEIYARGERVLSVRSGHNSHVWYGDAGIFIEGPESEQLAAKLEAGVEEVGLHLEPGNPGIPISGAHPGRQGDVHATDGIGRTQNGIADGRLRIRLYCAGCAPLRRSSAGFGDVRGDQVEAERTGPAPCQHLARRSVPDRETQARQATQTGGARLRSACRLCRAASGCRRRSAGPGGAIDHRTCEPAVMADGRAAPARAGSRAHAGRRRCVQRGGRDLVYPCVPLRDGGAGIEKIRTCAEAEKADPVQAAPRHRRGDRDRAPGVAADP
jgi:hypothetical protein